MLDDLDTTLVTGLRLVLHRGRLQLNNLGLLHGLRLLRRNLKINTILEKVPVSTPKILPGHFESSAAQWR